MPPPQGTIEIIDGCLAGRQDSWEAFVEKFSRLVYWAIWRVIEHQSVPSKEDFCQEVFQDFFVKLLDRQHMTRFSEIDNPESYLCVMASHLTFDKLRKSSSDEAFRTRWEQTVSEEDPSPDPSASLLVDERECLLEEVLSELSPKEKACVELHYASRRTHQEIASLLALPLDTVSSLIRRSREKLKQKLNDKGLKE